jgi:hypothetical protein
VVVNVHVRLLCVGYRTIAAPKYLRDHRCTSQLAFSGVCSVRLCTFKMYRDECSEATD